MNATPSSAETSADAPRARSSRKAGTFWVTIYVAIPLVGALYWYHRPAAQPDAGAFANRAPKSAASAGAPPGGASARPPSACANPRACACRRALTVEALDRSDPDRALDSLRRTPDACRAELLGLEAEALARQGKREAARRAATRAIASLPRDPYATYALAHVAYLEGNSHQAEALANAAIGMGRGGAAHLLVGMIAFRGHRLGVAKSAFAKVVEADPSNPAGHFNLAVVAHHAGRYRDAREGYLRTLRLDPDYLDARFNLALLAQSAGAIPEARHHLEKLRSRAKPGDPRVARLQRALEGHAEPAPSSFTTTQIPVPTSAAPSATPALAP